jgi:NAD(P)-dependent dehydrogenase (short-subunit alcohol dehydrogenase family)
MNETDIRAPVKTDAPALYEEIITRTPAGRFGNPDECAGTAAFLAPRAPDFGSGATICVDRGFPSGEILMRF